MMTFSVLIPNLGFNDYLIQCVDSIVNQDKNGVSFDYEIIVCDQSDIDIHNKIKFVFNGRYGTKVKIIYQSEKSLIKARIRLLQEALSEYIVFVDSDDYVSNCYLANICNELIDNKYPDVLITNFCLVDSNGVLCKKQLNVPPDIQDNLLDYFYYSNYLNSIWRKIFKKDKLDTSKISRLDIERGEDWIISYPLMKASKTFSFTKQSLGYFYRQNSGSITHSVNLKETILPIYFKDQIIDIHMNKYQKELYLKQKLYDFTNCLSFLLKKNVITYKLFIAESKRFKKNISSELNICKLFKGLSNKEKILVALFKLNFYFFIFIFLKY